jgi:RimJ/RimL family protein N-acetyltransferase
MQHELILEGCAFRIRPVKLCDASFILKLRASDSERLKFIHKVKNDLSAQESWINDYLARPGDYYWIVERKNTNTPEGTIAIYNFDKSTNSAEWGRWVLSRHSIAAIESSLLVYRVAFEMLQLKSTYCLTVAGNERVVSFHDSCGAKRESVLKNHFMLNGKPHDAVKHQVLHEEYLLIKDRLERLSKIIAQRIKP